METIWSTDRLTLANNIPLFFKGDIITWGLVWLLKYHQITYLNDSFTRLVSLWECAGPGLELGARPATREWKALTVLGILLLCAMFTCLVIKGFPVPMVTWATLGFGWNWPPTFGMTCVAKSKVIKYSNNVSRIFETIYSSSSSKLLCAFI